MQKFYDTIGQILSMFRPKKYCIIVRAQVWIEDSQKSALPQISWVIFDKSLQREVSSAIHTLLNFQPADSLHRDNSCYKSHLIAHEIIWHAGCALARPLAARSVGVSG